MRLSTDNQRLIVSKILIHVFHLIHKAIVQVIKHLSKPLQGRADNHVRNMPQSLVAVW